MTEEINQEYPASYLKILEATESSGFTMASDVLTCSLLRTLAATKPSGKFLELGTGTGLSTSWILAGMDENSTLTTIDNEKMFLDIAQMHLGSDERIIFILEDGGEWVERNRESRYDYIFADTWHGKYLVIAEVLQMLNKGGIYIIDDMLPQENWPEGHGEKALQLIKYLEKREDLFITRMNWATGIIIAVKK